LRVTLAKGSSILCLFFSDSLLLRRLLRPVVSAWTAQLRSAWKLVLIYRSLRSETPKIGGKRVNSKWNGRNNTEFQIEIAEWIRIFSRNKLQKPRVILTYFLLPIVFHAFFDPQKGFYPKPLSLIFELF